MLMAEHVVPVLVRGSETLHAQWVPAVQHDPGACLPALEEAEQVLQRLEQEPHALALDHLEHVDRAPRVEAAPYGLACRLVRTAQARELLLAEAAHSSSRCGAGACPALRRNSAKRSTCCLSRSLSSWAVRNSAPVVSSWATSGASPRKKSYCWR